MIRHYCDGCGKEVCMDTGVVGAKELTVEDDEGLKISIAFEVDTMKGGHTIANPVVCARCIARRVTEWATAVEAKQNTVG